MTSAHDIDLHQFLTDRLTDASPDLLRSLLSTFIDALMGAEADSLCGAGFGERSENRTNSRNGYRHRDFDTRAGTLDVAIPKLRQGSYFPDWLLQRRKRAERALTSVVATCYLLGVSTRRMEKLVDSLGITSLSKSQVSVMAKDLDAQVEAFRSRPLDAGPYTSQCRRRPRPQGPGERAGGERARPGRGRSERRGLPGNPGNRGDLRRGRGRLVGVLPVAGGPRPVRGAIGDLRRPRRPRVGDRRLPARGRVAEVPDAL
ncbi:Transposase for insertion sequence element IS1081 (plasmid) [Rhodococcus opacus]|uniref:Mutator family transposase n=1 Tax=Rhodococcus opacus TaxID=37919 RepID=A0A1B1KHA4_RHOOP|nr:Transposase for insertion sequence element IS1081 [Rhodococcus opacus]